MKIFTMILLMGLLVWLSSSTTGFAIVGPVSTSTFICLHSTLPNFRQYAVIRAYQNSHSPAGIDPYALQTIKNANFSEFISDIYIEICRGINATSQINLVKT